MVQANFLRWLIDNIKKEKEKFKDCKMKKKSIKLPIKMFYTLLAVT